MKKVVPPRFLSKAKEILGKFAKGRDEFVNWLFK